MKNRFLFVVLAVIFSTLTIAHSSLAQNQTITHTIKSAPPSKPISTHLIAEFWQTQKKIETAEELKKILVIAAKETNSVPLKVAIETFEPQGITGVILLAESHISVHAWPENNYVAIDAFTCGEHTVPQKAIAYLQKQFQPQEVQIQELKRGIRDDAEPAQLLKPIQAISATQIIPRQDLTQNDASFGQELVLNLKNCTPETIKSAEKILQFVDELCVLIDIKKYGKPFIERFAEHSKIAAGYSIAQMIETSLISGHFSEYLNTAYLNIFSCKPFDAEVARDFAKQFFGAKSVEAQLLVR